MELVGEVIHDKVVEAGFPGGFSQYVEVVTQGEILSFLRETKAQLLPAAEIFVVMARMASYDGSPVGSASPSPAESSEVAPEEQGGDAISDLL